MQQLTKDFGYWRALVVAEQNAKDRPRRPALRAIDKSARC